MTLWLLEPRDPLIFRDGRPFHATPGARAMTLPFPFPSTLAGAIRTRSGQGDFSEANIQRLKNLSIRGPFLAEVDRAGNVISWLFPAPADALLLKQAAQGQAKRVWLRPVHLPEGVQTAMPDSLHPVSPNPTVQEKPHRNSPMFWHWAQLASWLAAEHPEDGLVDLTELGIQPLPRESRVHVRIGPEAMTAMEGYLFQTEGLRFHQTSHQDKRLQLQNIRYFALAVETEAEFPSGLGFLGGERRIMAWRQGNDSLPPPPDAIKQRIVENGYARLMLITPGSFRQGYLPSEGLTRLAELQIHILGVAMPRRPEHVSGWDMEIGRPKPTRRLAPAGTIYFVKLEGSAQARAAFVDALWLQSISDEPQDRRDGFGLALLGAWDGQIETLEVHDEAT